MAETKDDIEVTEDKSGSVPKILLIIIAVLILALIGVGAMLFLGGDDKAATDETTTDEAAAIVKQPPIYYTVEAPLVINFADQSKGAVRYLQIKLKIMARDQAVIDAVELNLPAIQHELLLLLYGQSYDELSTSGTQALQQEVLDKINTLLKPNKLPAQLEAVYFTSFLMQ